VDAHPSKTSAKRSSTPSVSCKQPIPASARQLLGVPYTWLLAQARAGRIPHHRLGHYVRFDPEDYRRRDPAIHLGLRHFLGLRERRQSR
jgi:hypothetical protein